MRLYVHWPFCVSRCAYCDFNSRVASRRCMREYMRALLTEIDAWSHLLEGREKRLASIYLGGGTPSTLSGEEISALIRRIIARFGIVDDAEITVEVNPATWKYGDYAAAVAGGVNRVSIGVQSLHDPFLRMLGRAHDAAEAIRALRDARRSGAVSVSADLLLGLPGMDVRTLLQDLYGLLEERPGHLSLYALTLYEGSRLARSIRAGKSPPLDEDEAAEQYLAACGELEAAGFEHYEISNFCLPGHYGRHNMAYWEREEYLGAGAGAHSFLAGCRLRNMPSVLAYTSAMEQGKPVIAACERIGEEGRRAEEIILGLRTSRGVPDNRISSDQRRLEELEGLGLLRRRKGNISLTTRGMLVSNTLIAELLPA